MKYLITTALALLLTGPAFGQSSKPSNAKVGITNDNPQAVSVLDAGNVWAVMGAVDKATHVFTPVGTAAGGGGTLNWPGTAGLDIGGAPGFGGGTMPFVNAYLANGLGVVTPLRIACPDGTTTCFSGGGGGTFTWPGTAGVAGPGSPGTSGTMPFANVYINGTLPPFASVPTVNIGTFAGIATAVGQTNGLQKTQVVDPAGNTLFGSGRPGLIACPDGTTSCFSSTSTLTWPGSAGVASGGAATAGTMPFVNAYLSGSLPAFAATPTFNIGTAGSVSTSANQVNGNQLTRVTSDGSNTLFGATAPGRIACPDGTTACFAGGGGGTFTWPGTAGVAGPNGTTAGTMPFVNTYLNGVLPPFSSPPTFNVGTSGAIATSTNQTSGGQKTQTVDGTGATLFVAGKPGLIACPDGTIGCFWPGTAVASAGGSASAGTMPYVNAYLDGTLPPFASTPTVNLGTIAGIALAANQTNGNQETRITTTGSDVLFGATTPGRIACPDGTVNCFAGGGGGTFTWPGTAGLSTGGTASAGTMPYVNAYLNGTLPAFASTPTFNLGSIGLAASAANQTSGGQKTQTVDGSGNTIFVSGKPGLIACPDGTINCFWPGTAVASTGGATSGGTMPYVNAYLPGPLPAFAVTPTFNCGSGCAGAITWPGTATPSAYGTAPSGTVPGVNSFVTNFPATQAITAASLPLPAGAMQQSGGSVGISGTLPAFTATPTFNCGTGCGGSLTWPGTATPTTYGAAPTGTVPGINASVTNFPATQAISAASLPLPAGAMQQSGGTVGLTGTLPAFAAAPTVNIGTAGPIATAANQTNGTSFTHVTSTGSDTLFGATTPGRIACPDGTTTCFAGGAAGNVFQATITQADNTAIATTIQIAAPSGTLRSYLINYSAVADSTAASAATFQVISGTGATCGTGTKKLTPQHSFTANNGIAFGSIGPLGISNAGDGICVVTTTTNKVNWSIGVTQL